MSTYLVRTNPDRVISLEAEECRFLTLPNGRVVYNFLEEGEPVASFNFDSVLGVVREEVFNEEFSAYENDPGRLLCNTNVAQAPEATEGCDDVCLDCRFEEFLESDQFIDAVLGLIDAWHEDPDTDLPTPTSPPPPVVELRTYASKETFGKEGVQ